MKISHAQFNISEWRRVVTVKKHEPIYCTEPGNFGAPQAFVWYVGTYCYVIYVTILYDSTSSGKRLSDLRASLRGTCRHVTPTLYTNSIMHARANINYSGFNIGRTRYSVTLRVIRLPSASRMCGQPPPGQNTLSARPKDENLASTINSPQHYSYFTVVAINPVPVCIFVSSPSINVSIVFINGPRNITRDLSIEF